VITSNALGVLVEREVTRKPSCH